LKELNPRLKDFGTWLKTESQFKSRWTGFVIFD
jgi:hypothetical protein